MGNFTNTIIIVASISLVAGLLVMMAQDISADAHASYDQMFFGDYVFSQFDVTTQYVNGSQSSNSWSIYKTSINDSDLPSQSTTGTDASGFKFPDWLKSGWSWVTSPISTVTDGVARGTKVFLNIVGIPYTIIKSINMDARASAALAGYFSTIIFVIWVMFVLGREN